MEVITNSCKHCFEPHVHPVRLLHQSNMLVSRDEADVWNIIYLFKSAPSSEFCLWTKTVFNTDSEIGSRP